MLTSIVVAALWAPPVEIEEWTAPSGCSSSSVVAAAIRNELGSESADGPVRVRVVVRRGAEEEVEVRVHIAYGTLQAERSLALHECREVPQALALIVALAVVEDAESNPETERESSVPEPIVPNAVAPRDEASEPLEPGMRSTSVGARPSADVPASSTPSTGGSEETDGASSSVAEVLATERARIGRVKSASNRDQPSVVHRETHDFEGDEPSASASSLQPNRIDRSARRWGLGVGLKGGGSFGFGLPLSGVLGVDLSFVWPHLRVHAGFAYQVERLAESTVAPAAGLRFSRYLGRVAVGPTWRVQRFEFPLFAWVEAGAMQGESEGVANARRALSPWVAIGATASVKGWWWPRVSLGLAADLAGAIVRPTYALDDITLVDVTPIGGSVRFELEAKVF